MTNLKLMKASVRFKLTIVNNLKYWNLKQHQQRQITMKRYFQIQTTVSINIKLP